MGDARAVIVDGWPMTRIGLSRVLGSAGVRTVAEAGTAADALACLREAPAELLVIGDHGGVTADVVREAVGLRASLRVVVLLSTVTPGELRTLLGAGVNGLLSRAVGPDELADAVAGILAGERVVAPSLLPLLFEGEPDPTPGNGPDLRTGALLTTKEREVTRLLAGGASNAAIATAMFVSEATVKTHLAHIYAKLGARGRHEAVSRAVALGIVA